MSIIDLENMLKEEIENESRLYSFMRRRKGELPEGSLEIKNGKYGKYCYQKLYIDGKQQSIFLDPASEVHMQAIEELMEKKTIIHAVPILRNNIKSMTLCASQICRYDPLAFQFGNRLGSDYYLPDDVCLKEWLNKDECVNPYKPENRIHDTKRGPRVRSKSEGLISDMLFDEGIMHKYEPELKLGKRVVYPDFELIHPVTFKIIWWEHLGMIDNGDYARASLDKIDEYSKHDIYVGKNLILTWETKDEPLTRSMIEKRFSEYGIK